MAQDTLCGRLLGSRLNDISLGEPDLLAPECSVSRQVRPGAGTGWGGDLPSISESARPSCSPLQIASMSSCCPAPTWTCMAQCKLQITHENIYLDIIQPRREALPRGPLCSLRRYGRDATRFTFEAGR